MRRRLDVSLISDPSLDPGLTAKDRAIGAPVRALQARTTGPSPDTTMPNGPELHTAHDRLDAAVAEMREFLNLMNPDSDAQALQSLRRAFPAVPLSDRVAAIQTRFFS